MNKLTSAKRVAVVAALVEGKHPRDGPHDGRQQAHRPEAPRRHRHGLHVIRTRDPQPARAPHPVRRNLEFVYAKAKNVPDEKRGEFGYGDVWTWSRIDADTKLVVSYRSASVTLATATTSCTTLPTRSRTASN